MIESTNEKTPSGKAMSLKKKIVLSFFISAFIIAVLAAFEFFSFVELRKEIRYLEITDTISRKSLQLRRHEKNFFLYSPQKADMESGAVRAYLDDLKDILARNPGIDRLEQKSLRVRIDEYDRLFTGIVAEAGRLNRVFEQSRLLLEKNARTYRLLVEETFLERPAQAAEFLVNTFHVSPRHELITGLRDLDSDILSLRKTGEDILIISKDLDKTAREKAETVIRFSQIAILIFFPLFFIAGIGMLFLISTNVVRRLMLLINVVEKAGAGSYPRLTVHRAPGKAPDEVGLLIEKFNAMEDQLAAREEELVRKNKELMQTKKLAAIGTLASGVAHELNNPLNNIYLSAQVLARATGEGCADSMKEAVGDIVGQTRRVKRIVGDLLEFARGRDPLLEQLDICALIRESYGKITADTAGIRFTLDCGDQGVLLAADAAQMEQVFINLFTNAVDAMPGGGDLAVRVVSGEDAVTVSLSDSGKGIPKDSLDKIFEPFYTTKDKGTGLGLAIVFNIIRKHYGDIRAASEKGKGVTFTMTLPKSL